MLKTFSWLPGVSLEEINQKKRRLAMLLKTIGNTGSSLDMVHEATTEALGLYIWFLDLFKKVESVYDKTRYELFVKYRRSEETVGDKKYRLTEEEAKKKAFIETTEILEVKNMLEVLVNGAYEIILLGKKRQDVLREELRANISGGA